MTSTVETSTRPRAPRRKTLVGPVPVGLVAVMRRELPNLANEITAEIRQQIPEYARPMSGPYGQAIRIGVEQALTAFVDHVENPAASYEARDEVCRRLGQYEAQEGRSLDSLQAAYRIGIRASWRRIMKVAQQYKLPMTVLSRLVDALFDYLEELATLSRQGYLEAQARSASVVEHWHRRLIRLILERPPAPASAIRELAALAGWAVPGQVTLVALGGSPTCDRTLLAPDVLADFDCAEPHLLIPGPLTEQRESMLELGLPDLPMAISPAVALDQATEALRWARQALALAQQGAIGPGPVIHCEDYLIELLLQTDAALVDQIARHRLGALSRLSQRRRRQLTETLRVWLETRGSASRMAERLSLHPQTARYRVRQIEQIFGDQLDDPDARFAMDVVLRAHLLRKTDGVPSTVEES